MTGDKVYHVSHYHIGAPIRECKRTRNRMMCHMHPGEAVVISNEI